jgi:hypothetical protein
MPRTIAVILEWENATGLERETSLAFLRALLESLQDSRAARQHDLCLLLVFDERVDAGPLEADLRALWPGLKADIEVGLLQAPGTPYYAKKGLAAFFTDADIIVFADSDCDYAPGWLDALVTPLLNDETDLTCGDTVAAHGTSFVERTSALAWFFPTNTPHDPLRTKSQRRFFANNFAAKTSALRACPPPRHAGSRSHGRLWLQRWNRAGLRHRKVPGALARHKQYETVSALLARAWLFGKDKDYGHAALDRGQGYRLSRAVAAFFELPVKFLRRFVLASRGLLKPVEIVPAFLLGLLFQGIAATAQLVHAVRGRPVRVTYDYADLIAAARLLPANIPTQPPCTRA